MPQNLNKVFLEVEDIEIGAVEIKDATSDTRAVVSTNGLAVDVKAMPAITGTVSVSSIPAITGTVNVSNTVNITGSITGAVDISTMPAITGTVDIATMPAITGTVDISTIPAITGTVSVNSMPAMTGTVSISTMPVMSTKTALTPLDPTNASITATSSQAVAANSSRKGLVIINTGANIVSLGLGTTAVYGKGITLNANGGTWEMDEYSFCTNAINAVCFSLLTSSVAVQEFT